MTSISLKLSDELLADLQQEAERRELSLEETILDILDDYFEEPSKEEILEDIRQAMHDIKAGRTIPFDQVMAELKEEFGSYADEN